MATVVNMKQCDGKLLRRLGALLWLLCLPDFAGLDKEDGALAQRVAEIFAEWDRPDSPGCALGVIKNGQFLLKPGFGMASLDYDIPISSKSVFRIASTSKQITAAVIVLLEEDGTLSLDDSVRKHIPELPDYFSPVTLRHLVHHTSGIRDYISLMSMAGKREKDYYSDEEVLRLLARQKQLNFTPGERYLYSNSGYFLLSHVVKRATGQSLGTRAKRLIFQPLGMHHSFFNDDATRIVKNRATGYSPLEGGGFRINETGLGMIGDGGVFTTVEDLLPWDRNFYDNRLSKKDPAFLRTMLTPGRLNDGSIIEYAHGLMSGTYRGHKTVSHSGIFVGFRSEMIRFPEDKLTVICLCNLRTINPSFLAKRVADLLLVNERGEGLEAPAAATFIALPDQALKRLTGTYRHYEMGVISVTREGDALLVRSSSNLYRIRPVSPDRFKTVDGTGYIDAAFQISEKDARVEITVEEQRRYTFERFSVTGEDVQALSAYAADYYSEELAATYHIRSKNEALYLDFITAPTSPLIASRQDEFITGGLELEFFRDKRGRVAGFKLSDKGAKDILFKRL